MNKRMLVSCAVMLIASAIAQAAEPKTAKAPKTAPARVSVAVLDFQANLPGNKDLGSQIADILTARLSIEDSFDLVERASLSKILDEQKLKLVGMVDQEQSAKIGKLVGAKLLIMGKAFAIDKKLMIVTKVVGVETGRLKGSLRQADLNKPLSEAIMLLSEDVAGLIIKSAATLLPKGSQLVDPLVALRKTLLTKKRPSVAIVITEEHRRSRPAPEVIDPAVETEIKKVLISCGITVVDTGRNDLADWAKKAMKTKDQAWPPALDKADYVIIGEAFSEFALRTGDLVTCAARAEINVIERKTGKIIYADRHTDRGIDLAEALAGKTALQKTGRRLAVRTVQHFAKTLPNAPKPKTKK
jgi:TolB-like protein